MVVESERSEARARVGLPSEAPVVAVGLRANNPYAASQKNLVGLLDAVSGVRGARADTRLLVIGATRAELASFGVDLPDWAVATGFVSRPADLVASSDVVAVPSNAEGNSNIACEALMLGLPVASTDVGDHGEVVVSTGGRVVPSGDVRGLEKPILQLLQDPPDRAMVRSRAEEVLASDRVGPVDARRIRKGSRHAETSRTDQAREGSRRHSGMSRGLSCRRISSPRL